MPHRSRPRRGEAEQRLLDALTRQAGSRGFADLTVEHVLDASGVSRATFYSYFSNVADCFRAAYLQHSEILLNDVVAAISRAADPQLAMLDALVQVALDQPERARILMSEGLAAGTQGLKDRDALMSQLQAAVTTRPPARPVDLPAAVLIGATFRFLSMRLSNDEPLDRAREEIRQWADTFAAQPSEISWSARFALPLPRQALRSPAQSSRPHLHGTPRQRILKATALATREKGYLALSVADIVQAAGVSRRTFYNEFPSKQEAFAAAYEHGFQQTLAACTPAFLTPRTWPERVWNGAEAFTRFLAGEPLLAHLGFVECYSVSAQFTRRVHDAQLAFTLFLEEGYRQSQTTRLLSRACSTLTATAIFEAAFEASRSGSSLHLRGLHRLAVFVALTPFIGREGAGSFVEGKIAGR